MKKMILAISYAVLISAALTLIIYSIATHHIMTARGDIILKDAGVETGNLTFTYLLFVKTSKLTMEIDGVPDPDPTEHNFQELCEHGDDQGKTSSYCKLKGQGHAFEVMAWISVVYLILLLVLLMKMRESISRAFIGVPCMILGCTLMSGYWIVYFVLKENNCALQSTLKKKAGAVAHMIDDRQFCWNHIDKPKDNDTSVEIEISIILWLSAGCILIFIALTSCFTLKETNSHRDSNAAYTVEDDQNAIDLMELANEEEEKANAQREEERKEFNARASQMDFDEIN